MKGYYIHFEGRGIIGVSKKIDMQLAEFRKHYEMEEIEIKRYSMSVLRNGLAILPFFSICWDYKEAYERITEPDFLYIRKAAGERSHYVFLKYIKKKYPDCKIIVEIPTYPYWKDALRRITGVLLIKDFYNYCVLYRKLIDRIVTFSEDERIFGFPTIRTQNGIHVDGVQKIAPKEDCSNELHLLAVAWMSVHHGYDRMIRGLANYYKQNPKENVYLHMVGVGPEKQHLMQLTNELDLGQYIFFYDTKVGAELQSMYDMADIAVSTLGFHRENLKKFSTLKAIEYLAEGLPVISEETDRAFEGTNKEFVCEFSPTEEDIDIFQIIDFYQNLTRNRTRMELAEDIRQFAKTHVDNAITMKPILDYIDGK